MKRHRPVVLQFLQPSHEFRQRRLAIGQRHVHRTEPGLAVLIAAIGFPLEVLDTHQRNPRGDEVQAHFPTGQPPLDGHVHRIDVGTHGLGIEVLEDQVQDRAAVGEDPSRVDMHTGLDSKPGGQLDEPFEFPSSGGDLLEQRTERLVSPVPQLDLPDAVVGTRGDHVPGERAVGSVDPRRGHQDLDLLSHRHLVGVCQAHLGVLGQHVATGPQRQVKTVKAPLPDLPTHLLDLHVGQVVSEQRVLHL